MKYTQSMLGVTVAEAQSIASVLSGQLKVTIREGREWKYDEDRGAVTYRKEDLKVLTQEDVIANLLHETGHAKYTQDLRMWNFGTIPPQHKLGVKLCVDLLEDFRMEDKLRGDYPYAVDYLPTYSFKTKWYFQEVTKQYEQKALESGQAQEIPKLIQYLNLIYSYISGEAVLVLGETNKEVQEAVKKTQEKMQDIRDNATSTLDIVKAIREDIYPDIKHLFEDSPDPQKSPSSGEGEDGDGEGKPKPGAGKPSPRDGFDSKETQSIAHGFGAVLSDVPEEEHEPYDDMYPYIKNLINKTADKLRKVLTDKAFDKFEGKFTSGKKLNQRRMYKPRLGDYRVFQRRIEASQKDYEFALVVDMSGSMSGSKIKHAVQASMLFGHVLEKLEIPHIIYGFNRYMFPYKQSAQKYDKKMGMSIAKSMWAETYGEDGSKHGAGDNNDAEAVYQVKKLLQSSKSTKKIMMVFTDGQPANSEDLSYKHRDLAREVKKTISEGINVIGVGLHYGGLDRYYPHNIVVDDMDKLPDETVKIVKQALKK